VVFREIIRSLRLHPGSHSWPVPKPFHEAGSAPRFPVWSLSSLGSFGISGFHMQNKDKQLGHIPPRGAGIEESSPVAGDRQNLDVAVNFLAAPLRPAESCVAAFFSEP